MKGRLFSIFILLCFTAPLATSYVALQFQRRHIRRTVKKSIVSGLKKSELVLLKLTKDETPLLKWKHSKEFEYNNQMYDIVESETKGDTTLYWCWEDHEETALNQKLDRLALVAFGNHPQHQENNKKLQSFFKSLYFTDLVKNSTRSVTSSLPKNHFLKSGYLSLTHSPTVPPPEFSC